MSPEQKLMLQQAAMFGVIFDMLKTIDEPRARAAMATALESCAMQGCGDDIPRSVAESLFPGLTKS